MGQGQGHLLGQASGWNFHRLEQGVYVGVGKVHKTLEAWAVPSQGRP